MNSRRTVSPIGFMETISPFLGPILSMMAPWYSEGTSTTRYSIGSCLTPSTMRMMTSGLETAISKPSRRMFSIRMERCSSPRPETWKVSALAVLATLSETLVLSSRSRRSRMFLEVTSLPSRPAKGEELTMKFMERVGSSIAT